jgi:Cell cycle and development regulator
VIYNLLSMENKGDPLPVPVNQSSSKAKTPKKEEQYKMMFAELERFLSAHCRTERHNRVLDCLLEVRNRAPVKRKDSDKVDLDVALREIERYSMTDKRADYEEPASRSRSETPPPPLKKPKLGGQNLLQIFLGRIEKENSKMGVPFSGMKSVGEKAKLYLSLERKEKDETVTPMDLL